MSATTLVLSWALGGACTLLGAFTVDGWLRQRDRTRAFLALSIVLLCGCGVAVAATMLTRNRAVWTSDLSLTLFLASGWAFFGFRAAMDRLHVVVSVAAGAVVLAAIALVSIAGVALSGVQSTGQRLVVVVLTVVWLGCVVEPVVRLWRISAAMPRVQRARLRAITLAFVGVGVALFLSIGTGAVLGSDHPEITVALPALAVLPLLYVGFGPPRWLLGFWRQREEGHFREAFTDLVLYSPDRQRLAERAVEWAARLVGADGAVIATDDGEVLAVHGLDRTAGWKLASEVTGQGEARSVTSHPTNARGVIRVVLEAQLSRGMMAVTSGPLTPLFGDDEAVRLTQYATALAPALDRVLLVERMRRSSQLLDLAYDAVTTWNVRTQLITFWNKGAEELYGWTSDEAIGRNPGELLHSELPESRDVILAVLRAEGRWEGEVIQTTRTGNRINVAVRWALQKDGVGWPDAVIEIGRDVTADKVAAADLREARDVAEQASQAKSEYLSRMSHELRTPLTAILGYSDLLEMREPRDDQTEAIAAVQEASGHLLSLVNDVLDIARIESGREAFSLEPVALEATVEECVRLVAPSALSRHIKITRSLGDCAAEYVLADRQRLVQALLNLLSNAVKYSGKEAHIFVEASREPEADGPAGSNGSTSEFIRLAVRDTGPGFTDDEKARLFQPFERLGAERTPVPGTGLGLALTRKLVQGMHGTIGVESERGSGSAFWIRLSRSPIAAPKPRIRRKAPVVPVVSCERTVLYVEDNLATIGLMEEVFSMRPQIHLLTAMQGGLTLELAREHHPDLIVLDLHLPDIQGDVVLEQLRADPRTAGIPVVMCSADATERRRKELIAAGARAYLTKPMKVQRFLRMLDEVLNSIPVTPA
ncbi:MAG TPA: ATP-binding protein [Candidatus Saccharimonadales bacterium]|nr:ATP-binding protein [Candidatus Saccharimonadales bacterium]